MKSLLKKLQEKRYDSLDLSYINDKIVNFSELKNSLTLLNDKRYFLTIENDECFGYCITVTSKYKGFNQLCESELVLNDIIRILDSLVEYGDVFCNRKLYKF